MSKVAFLVDSLVHCGGLERALTTRVNHLSSNHPDIKVSVITLDPKGAAAFEPIVDDVVVYQLDVKFRRSERLTSMYNLRIAASYLKKLRDTLKACDPECVVNCGYGYDTFMIPLVARNAWRVKEVHSTRWKAARDGFLTRLKGHARAVVERRYHSYIALSEEEAELAQHPRVSVIPNPVMPSSPSCTRLVREKVVLAAGRLTHIKGFDRLIDAWALVAADFPEWRLQIYGDGDHRERAALEQRIAGHGLESSVGCAPAVHDLEDRMKRASIYALPSREECLPMVILESLQVELPVVAFDCPTGPRNIMAGTGFGSLVPDGDIPGFADALRSLMASPALCRKLSVVGPSLAAKYRVDAVTDQWADLIRSSGGKRGE